MGGSPADKTTNADPPAWLGLPPAAEGGFGLVRPSFSAREPAFLLPRTLARPPLPSAPSSRSLEPRRVSRRGDGWRPCRQTQMLEDGEHRGGLGDIAQDPPPRSARAPEHILKEHPSDQRGPVDAGEGLRRDARPEATPWPRFAPRTGRRRRSTLLGRVALRRCARALRSLPLPGLPRGRARPLSACACVPRHDGRAPGRIRREYPCKS